MPSSLHASARPIRLFDTVMAVLALAVVPALILEERATSPTVRMVAVAVNWVIWLAFVTEFVVGLTRAEDRRGFVRSAWLNLIIIAVSPPFIESAELQGFRAFRVLRLLRLVHAAGVLAVGLRSARRAFGRRKFHYVATFAIATLGLSAFAIFVIEGGQNRAIASIGDAFWWAIVTATTVGYGDVSPVTTEGRMIAVFLMLTGIGVIGVFTATITSMFLGHDEAQAATLEERLAAVEAKLDLLLLELRKGR